MRTWLVIPAMGAAAPAAAIGLHATTPEALAAAAAGAALAAAVRALAGDSPAALTGAVIAPLLAVAAIAERGGGLAAPCLALAGVAWTTAELARPSPGARPLVALLPATIAAILAPAAAALLAIAGARLALGPGPRPRWAITAPLAGALAVALAIAAGLAPLGGLAELWFGAPARPIAPAALAARAGDALGPIAAIAALAGLVALARPRARPGSGRAAELAVAACVAGALLADLRAGAIGPLTLGLAALVAGLGAARFAGQIRLPAGQAFAGATVGLMLLLPPAWGALDREDARAGIALRSARASR